MSITLDIPPAMMQKVEAYAHEAAISMTEAILDCIRSEIVRRSVRKAAAKRFRNHVDSIAAHRTNAPVYKFNRADAYDDSMSGARNYDFP